QRASGVDVEARGAAGFTLREGKVICLKLYQSRDEGLEAVALAEEAVSANLYLVRSILMAWERGDYGSADWAHPEIEYVMVDGPEPGRWKGLAEMAEAARKGLDAWKDVRFEVEEYRELDDG